MQNKAQEDALSLENALTSIFFFFFHETDGSEAKLTAQLGKSGNAVMLKDRGSIKLFVKYFPQNGCYLDFY